MLSAIEAFNIALPRRPAVLCIARTDSTDMIAVSWFTWLNMKRQPMLSFALERNSKLGLDIDSGDELYLLFAAAKEVEKYKNGIKASNNTDNNLPAIPISTHALPIKIPASSDIALRCTLAGAYNYPFKKVRIFNCNFEEAIKLK